MVQRPESEVPDPNDNFWRCADQDLAEVTYLQAAPLGNHYVYFSAAGRLFSSSPSPPSYRYWLRGYGREQGLMFHRSVSCKVHSHSPSRSVEGDDWTLTIEILHLRRSLKCLDSRPQRIDPRRNQVNFRLIILTRNSARRLVTYLFLHL